MGLTPTNEPLFSRIVTLDEASKVREIVSKHRLKQAKKAEKKSKPGLFRRALNFLKQDLKRSFSLAGTKKAKETERGAERETKALWEPHEKAKKTRKGAEKAVAASKSSGREKVRQAVGKRDIKKGLCPSWGHVFGKKCEPGKPISKKVQTAKESPEEPPEAEEVPEGKPDWKGFKKSVEAKAKKGDVDPEELMRRIEKALASDIHDTVQRIHALTEGQFVAKYLKKHTKKPGLFSRIAKFVKHDWERTGKLAGTKKNAALVKRQEKEREALWEPWTRAQAGVEKVRLKDREKMCVNTGGVWSGLGRCVRIKPDSSVDVDPLPELTRRPVKALEKCVSACVAKHGG